jgi:5-(carboxyamino)imidazole ribonucleotide synthase
MLSSRIGILGGGQLGLMLLQAAVDWNLDIHVLDPDAEAPCRKIAPHFTKVHYRITIQFTSLVKHLM